MQKSRFHNWSNEQLRASLEKWVQYERRSCVAVIEHVAEVILRRSYMEWGYTNIYDYLIKGLSYSERAANRRIQAARALMQIPEIKSEIETGSLNLSQVVMIQSAIRHEQKVSGPVSIEEKKEIFAEVSNKTVIETQKVLDQKFDIAPILSQEKHKHDDSVEVTVRMPKELFEMFNRIKELNSHVVPNGAWAEILKIVGKEYLKRHDPLEKNAVSLKAIQSHKDNPRLQKSDGHKLQVEVHNANNAATHGASDSLAQTGKDRAYSTIRKAIRPQVRRFIFQRDRVCQHRHRDGRICGSRFQLEIDHIQPKFAGGTDEVSNLRVLCRSHNQSRYRLSH